MELTLLSVLTLAGKGLPGPNGSKSPQDWNRGSPKAREIFLWEADANVDGAAAALEPEQGQ